MGYIALVRCVLVLCCGMAVVVYPYVGFIGVDVLYAIRDVILVQCACPTTRHGNAVTVACALQRTSSDVTR